MSKKTSNRNKILQAAGIVALTFTAGSAFANPVEYNLTSGPNLSATVNNAIFSNPSTLSNIISGTGVFNTFVQIQNNPIEQGYNTSARGGFPTNPPIDTNAQTNFDTDNAATHNHDIQLQDVHTLLDNGIVYRQFLLDINEGANLIDNFLSLDMLQIYISSTAGNFIPNDNQAALGANNALGALVYNMDGAGDSRILLNYNVMGSGSGRPDLQVLIPNNLFLSYTPNSYLYLYSRFGDKGCVDATGAPDPTGNACKNGGPGQNFSGDFGANSGFEEWSNLVGTNVSDFCVLNPTDPRCVPPTPPNPNAPEPGILSLLGLGLLGMATKARRKAA